MLIFECDDASETVLISGDAEGLRYLARMLEQLASRAEEGILAHDHLYSEAWGGYELSEAAERPPNAIAVNHVKIYGLPRAPGG